MAEYTQSNPHLRVTSDLSSDEQHFNTQGGKYDRNIHQCLIHCVYHNHVHDTSSLKVAAIEMSVPTLSMCVNANCCFLASKRSSGSCFNLKHSQRLSEF